MVEFRNPARQLAKVAFCRQTKTWLSLEVNKHGKVALVSSKMLVFGAATNMEI